MWHLISETSNIIILANSVILILEKILGLIKFLSIILRGNYMSCKEAFPSSNMSLLSCLSLTGSFSSVYLPFQFPCY